MRRILYSLALVIALIPTSGFIWLVTTQAGLNWTLKSVRDALGMDMTYHQLQGQLVGPIVIHQLAYHDATGLDVTVDQVRLDWRPRDLFSAHLNIIELTASGIIIQLPPGQSSPVVEDQPKAKITLPTITFPVDISMPSLAINDLTIITDQPQIIKHLGADITAQGQLVSVNKINVEMDNLVATTSGQIRLTSTLPHEIYVDWQVQSAEPLQARASLKGDMLQSHFEQQTSGAIAIKTAVDITNLLTAPDANFNIKSSDMAVTGIALWSYSDSTNPLQVNFNWENIHWPLQGPSDFNSPTGSGWLVGDGRVFRMGIGSTLDWADIQSAIYVTGLATTDHLDFDQLRIEGLAGLIQADGQVSWGENLQWQTQIAASDINPGTVFPQWPGQLNGQLKSNGALINNQLIADLEIDKIDGELRNYPIQLQGQASLNQETVIIPQILLTSGQSQLSIKGQITEQLAIDWNLNSPNIGELIPDSQGLLRANGTVSGKHEAPEISATVDGQEITLLSATTINALKAQISLASDKLWQPTLSASAEGIMYNDIVVSAIGVNVDRGNIYLTVVAEDNQLAVTMTGKGTDDGWLGQLDKTSIKSATWGNWSLANQVDVAISPTKAAIAPTCLISDTRPESQLCVDFSQLKEGTRSILTATSLTLATLDGWLPQDSHLDGVVNGSAEALLSADQLTVEARLTLPGSYIRLPLSDNPEYQWTYEKGEMVLTANDNGVQVQAQLLINDSDKAIIDIDLPQADLLTIKPSQQTIKAYANITLSNFDLIDAMVPQVNELSAKADITIDIDGTLAQPGIKTQINIDDGRLQVPRLGLNIDNIKLAGQTSDASQFNFRLDAASGKGHLNVVGNTRLIDITNWPTTLTISGENFEVSHIPEAEVHVSPKIKIDIRPREISIDGELLIPYANLKPKDISTAAQTSSDAVLINADITSQDQWKMMTRMKITLGERVNFFGFGYEGEFAGSLQIQDLPGQLTTAIGEFSAVNGRYQAYGQRLDIEQGSILFTGGPIANPGLDLRAVRHIGDVTAGIKVLGSLKDPQIELFSVPTMGQTDALSYLILGRTLETSTDSEGAMMANAALALGLSGGDQIARTLGDRFGFDEMRVESNDTGEQASLVIGRYLSPRLYISYGVGIIDAYNTFNVRYQISDKWQLKGENGEHQGADLLYTIER